MSIIERVQSLAETALDVVFGVVGGVGSICWDVTSFWLKMAFGVLINPIRERRAWQNRLEQATTFAEWELASHQLDRLDGKEAWRGNSQSSHYDSELIQSRLDQLHNAYEMRDTAALSFLLRTTLSRNFGDINNAALYQHCRIGTKHLIEEFNSQVVQSLYFLARELDHLTNPLQLKMKLDFFKDLRHTLGNTALLLSGGASLGMYHIGVMKALFENGLLPRIIAGSSSGSIMAAIICCRSEEDIPQLLRLEQVNLNMLEEALPLEQSGSWLQAWSRKIMRLLKHGVVFDAEVLKHSLLDNIGDITFLEAYRKTNRVLNITVSSTSNYDMPRLLNYITAPDVLVWSAVVASCALPALYQSAPLLAKDRQGTIIPWNVTGDRWIDGSVENDLPMRRLAELFNVNHFIVSQVNPHIYPFLKHASQPGRLSRLNQRLLYIVGSELNYRLDQMANFGILPKACRMLKSILSQKYYGDITIVPELTWTDIAHMFVDRPAGAILEAIRRGERATWEKLSLIRTQLQAELTLDEILLRIRDRLLDIGRGSVLAIPSDESPLTTRSTIDSPAGASTNSSLVFSAANDLLSPSTASDTITAPSPAPDDVLFDPTVNVCHHLSPEVGLGLSLSRTHSNVD